MSNFKLEQVLLSKLNGISIDKKQSMYDEKFSYQSIFLSSIIPDESNPRYLPILPINDHDAKLFTSRKITKNQIVKLYNAENKVLLGKSCIINALKYGSADWKKANKALESIIELGKNIKVSELIQVATIYPISSSQFKVLTGHRRYFSLIYANGYGSAAQFKVYTSKPLLMKVKQFQENASREDLPQYGKLIAFKDAISEVTLLNEARLKLGKKKLTIKEIATSLGISMGAYDNYNVLCRYSGVIEAYESGLSIPFVKAKKLVLDVESSYKNEHQKFSLNITDRNNINSEIKSRIWGGDNEKSSNYKYKIKPISSVNTIKSLLTTDITKLDIGIDWDDFDWEDKQSVNNTVSLVVDYFENNKV
jgi:hypothetical protein